MHTQQQTIQESFPQFVVLLDLFAQRVDVVAELLLAARRLRRMRLQRS